MRRTPTRRTGRGEARPVRAALLVPVVVALGVLTAACSGGEPAAGPTSRTGSPSPSATSAAPTPSTPPAPAPQVGSCHRLDVRSATAATDPAAAVPCRGPHTSVTVRVGRLPADADGHLLAVDSARLADRLQRTCPPTAPAVVGGDVTARRLTVLRTVWFTPTVAQAEAGADWFRCDVVALLAPGRLAPLPASVRGLLGSPAARARFGTCGTTAPDARGFQRLACSQRHAWQAVAVVDLPGGTRFLDRAAGDAADARCRAVASDRAGGALRFSWAFEWPQRAAWDAGQRYGWCWVPQA
ncbi:hypothetical protein GCM10027596_13510 [Nocardioides korecus]